MAVPFDFHCIVFGTGNGIGFGFTRFLPMHQISPIQGLVRVGQKRFRHDREGSLVVLSIGPRQCDPLTQRVPP